MVSYTPRLTIAKLEEGEEGTVRANEGMEILEAIATLEVLDRDLTTPPGSESDGDIYIVADSATGDWDDEDGNLAIYNSGYTYKAPKGGMLAFIKDEKQWWGYSSQESEWHPMQEIWSTTEHWTGKYSVVDGDKIYSKAISTGALPNATTDSTAHSVTGIALDNHFRAEGWASTGSAMLMLPCDSVQITLDATNLNIITGTDLSSYTTTYVRIEYTKT